MLVIAGGRVLSPHSPRGEARNIVVDGDTIVDLVAPGAVTNRNAAVLDARRRLIIPGLINAHTHSHGGLSKGVGACGASTSCSTRRRGSAAAATPRTSISPR
jgi:5-methylthioadenosine/S-adenosylhomocysteine deaminase